MNRNNYHQHYKQMDTDENTCCYTFDELNAMDWRSNPDTDQLEWFSLFDPKQMPLPQPCFHDDDKCPAKK